MGKIYTCCKRWWRFFALARRVWFIGQFFHTNPPDLLITTSITLVAAKAICLKPLQTLNLNFFSHSALHINLPPGSTKKQTRILSSSNGCSISYCSHDSNVPRFENASCNTCICSALRQNLRLRNIFALQTLTLLPTLLELM